MNTRNLKIFGWTVSLALIVFALFYFDWGKVYRAIEGVNLWFLPLLFFVYMFDFTLRTFRWKLLLSPIKSEVSFPKLFHSYNISCFANVFLPVRIGEFFRVLITGKEENISKRTILGTIFLERILDILGIGIVVILTILTIAFTKISTLDTNILFIFCFWAFIFIAGFLLSVIFVLIIKRFSFIKQKSKRIDKIIEILEPVYHGFSSVRDFLLLFYLVILSIFMWILNAIILYIYMYSLSFDTGFFDSIIVLVFQLFGEFVPAAPSSVGTFHASTVIGSKVVGLTADQGLVLGVLNHFIENVVKIIFGLFSIQLLNFKFRKILQDISLNKKLEMSPEED